jgi:hypothetical protein
MAAPPPAQRMAEAASAAEALAVVCMATQLGCGSKNLLRQLCKRLRDAVDGSVKRLQLCVHASANNQAAALLSLPELVRRGCRPQQLVLLGLHFEAYGFLFGKSSEKESVWQTATM